MGRPEPAAGPVEWGETAEPAAASPSRWRASAPVAAPGTAAGAAGPARGDGAAVSRRRRALRPLPSLVGRGGSVADLSPAAPARGPGRSR